MEKIFSAKAYTRAIKSLWREKLCKGPHKAARMLGLEKYSPLSMNPMEYWMLKGRDTRRELIDYYKRCFKAVAPHLSVQLRKDINELFRSGDATERLMVLTVLGELNRMCK